MSQASEFSRTAPSDAQSVQSVQTTRTAQSEGVQQHSEISSHEQQQQQQQHHYQQQQPQLSSSAQVERQRIQRSSSSASSKSTISGGGAASGQAEGPVGTGSYQQYSAGAGLATSNGSLGSNVSGERRQGRFRRQVIRLPDQPSGQVRQVRRRLPTPEPDTLERVYIQRTGGEVVEEITEIPTTPPPRVQERTVVEPAGPPQVIKRTIRVPPRSGGYGGYQQQGVGQHTTGGIFGGAQQGDATATYQQQTGGSFTGGYGAMGSASTTFQQQAGGSFGGGYGAGALPTASTFATNYSSVGGAGGLPQSKGPVTGPVSFVIDAGMSQAFPPAGCQPAFCFYV